MRVWIVLLVACGGKSAEPPMESPLDADAIVDAPPPSAACAGKQAQPVDATWTIAATDAIWEFFMAHPKN